jgi:hypothetical protein
MGQIRGSQQSVRAELRDWLDAQDIEESPEFLAAVHKRVQSAENETGSTPLAFKLFIMSHLC